MGRRLLVILLLALVALVLVGTIGRVRRSLAARAEAVAAGARMAVRPAAVPASQAAPPELPRNPPRPVDSRAQVTPAPTVAGLEAILPAPPGTRPLDRLVRLGVRRRLRAEGQRHYLDSLLATSDSTVRRWAGDSGPVPIAIVPGGPAGWRPALTDQVRAAFASWEPRAVGLVLEEVGDTTQARVLVRWVDHFPSARFGETSLVWDRSGRMHRAELRLALNDSSGMPLSPETLRVIAVHEAGHALGLPHSAEPTDVMHPRATVAGPSERDRLTLRLLYDLPLGSIRDSLEAP